MHKLIFGFFLVFWVWMAVLAVHSHVVDGYTFDFVGGLAAFGVAMLFGLPLFVSVWASGRYKGRWVDFGRHSVFVIENPRAFWKDITRLLRRFGISSMKPSRARRAAKQNSRRQTMHKEIEIRSKQRGSDSIGER
jgi:hypothetical protein